MSRRSERLVFQITMLVIALLFYVLLSIAHAGSISLHTGSKHAGGCDTCNEENWGIGWTGDEMLFGELLVAPLVHWRALPGAPVSPLVTYAPTPDGGVALFSVNWRY